jgi:hypothetical protein
LRVGGKVKVCNNEWTSFAAFNKVAVLSGSPLAVSDLKESEAMGVLQLLHIVAGNSKAVITPGWAWDKGLLTCRNNNSRSSKTLVEIGGKTVLLDLVCSLNGASTQLASKHSVGALTLDVQNPFESVADALKYLPSLDEGLELVAALSSLTELSSLDMLIGGGALRPQLASLRKLTTFRLRHYCLGGSIPANLLDGGWPRLKEFVVVPVASAIGAANPEANAGICGLSGSLLAMVIPTTTSALNHWRASKALYTLCSSNHPQLITLACAPGSIPPELEAGVQHNQPYLTPGRQPRLGGLPAIEPRQVCSSTFVHWHRHCWAV